MTTKTITIPAGTVLVLDIKTGGLKLDYWSKYAPQCAAYAGSKPYDVETDTRGEWPWLIDQDVALIAHIPVADILATGRCDISLVPVDLAAGRHAAELCVAAKAWNGRRDIFGTPVPVVTAEVKRGDGLTYFNPATGCVVELAGSVMLPISSDPFDGINGEATKPAPDWIAPKMEGTPITPSEMRRLALTARAGLLKATHPDAARWVAARWPQASPPSRATHP